MERKVGSVQLQVVIGNIAGTTAVGSTRTDATRSAAPRERILNEPQLKLWNAKQKLNNKGITKAEKAKVVGTTVEGLCH